VPWDADSGKREGQLCPRVFDLGFLKAWYVQDIPIGGSQRSPLPQFRHQPTAASRPFGSAVESVVKECLKVRL
jgi:hypothetical protein